MIRLTVPSIDDAEIAAVREVLESGFLVQGPKVAQFEQSVASYVGTKHAVAVSSGTAALHLSLLALGVGPGDIVVTTAYSWPATANVVELCGAKPVFVDICPNTYNIDPEKLHETLRELMSNADTMRRVKGILPVHTFGNPCDMPAIVEIAERYDLPVIEDAACALGSKIRGRRCGSWGVMGCFSFHPRKAITTGEGGMITTNSDHLARRLRALRNHGQDPDAPSTDFVLPGLNYRMSDLQGAMGHAQMAKLVGIIAARQKLAAEYDRLLSETPLTPQVSNPDSEANCQSYVTLLTCHLIPCRDDIIAQARSCGIETAIGTWHIPLTQHYRVKYGYVRGDFPATDRAFEAALTLPLYPSMTQIDLVSVFAILQRCLPSAAVPL